MWKGRRIISEDWIDAATNAHSDTSNTQTNNDWTAGYGYQFWRNRIAGYRGDGAFGQYCILLPEQDAVIAINGELSLVLRFRFGESELCLEIEPNVAWGTPTVSTIIGRRID